MTTADRRGRSSTLRTFSTVWGLLSLLCAAWALGTPIAAVPDEPAHLIKAGSVVRGELVGPTGENGQVVSVPRWMAATHAQACFAFDSSVTAQCADVVIDSPSEIVSASTTAGLYNPVYYAIVGLPSLVFADSRGVFGMRIVSGIATSAFLALSIAILAGLPRRRVPLLAAAVAVTPMVLFLGGAVNPNGLEIAATLAAFTGTMALVTNVDRTKLASRAFIVAASAAIAVNMRGLSPLWVAFALCVPLILMSRRDLTELLRRHAVRGMIVAISVATAGALAWTLGSGSLVSGIGAATTSERPEVPFTGASPLLGFYSIIDGTFELAANMIGLFGWLDTPAPVAVFVVWSIFVGILALLAFAALRGRSLAVAIVLAAGVIILPALVQAAYITGGGYIWQGRYTLPVFVCALVGIGMLLGDRDLDLNLDVQVRRRLTLALVTLWAAAQFAAFAQSIRRYSVGLLETWVSMLTSPDWQPPGGVILILAVFGIIVAGCAVLLYRTSTPVVESSGSGTADPAPELRQPMHDQPGRRAEDH